VEKYDRSRYVTDGKTVHALCMLDNQGYRHTQNMRHLLHFHSNNSNVNAHYYYLYTHFASHMYHHSAIRLHAAGVNVISTASTKRTAWPAQIFTEYKNGYSNAPQYSVVLSLLIFFMRNYIKFARKCIALKY